MPKEILSLEEGFLQNFKLLCDKKNLSFEHWLNYFYPHSYFRRCFLVKRQHHFFKCFRGKLHFIWNVAQVFVSSVIASNFYQLVLKPGFHGYWSSFDRRCLDNCFVKSELSGINLKLNPVTVSITKLFIGRNHVKRTATNSWLGRVAKYKLSN